MIAGIRFAASDPVTQTKLPLKIEWAFHGPLLRERTSMKPYIGRSKPGIHGQHAGRFGGSDACGGCTSQTCWRIKSNCNQGD